MFWFLAGLMCLAAAAVAVWPMLRGPQRSTGGALLTIVGVVGLAALIYALNGRPDVPAGRGDAPDIDAMVASLAARLQEQPDDIDGWKMLGRSYMNLGNFVGAAEAFERAVALEDAANADTLVEYGVALTRAGGQAVPPKAIAAFENAITIAPANQQALFWSGIGAFNRGDSATAAERWERLLEMDPPPEVRNMLVERIAAWRGEAVPSLPASHPPVAAAGAGTVSIDVSVSDAARAALDGDTTVFILAREPGQPGPPIAVARRKLSELPGQVMLSDEDAMLPGRNLSAFEEVEVIVRASASGSPTETPGDWYGAAVLKPAETPQIDIAIAEPVR